MPDLSIRAFSSDDICTDPTQLLGVTSSVQGISINTSQYSTALIKGLTYTLVLHPIALGACVLTFIFGLLAHCGDMSLRCLNGFFSGIASFITLIAVACDFALFLIAQKRINAVSGATASLGSALWMTLVAWILIILSSFSFCCSCCGSSGGGRRQRSKGDAYDDDAWKGNRGAGGTGGTKSDQMRMEALDAEADRKRRNNLPRFATYETEHVESLPLTHDYEGAGQQLRFADTSTNGGHGYHNPPYGYSEGHTPITEHDPYSYGYGQAMSTPTSYAHQQDSYIPGVGPGAPRTVPAATAYYDSSVSAPFSDTTQSPSTYPGAHPYNDNGSTFSRGTYRAPSVSSSYSRGQAGGDDYYNAQGAPPVPIVPSSYTDARYQQRQPSYRQGYSEHGQTSHYAEPSYMSQQANQSESPYDAVRQATLAGAQSRALSNTATSPRAEEVVYSPASRQASAVPDGGHAAHTGRSGDDGFGLAVLQAGIATRAANSSSGRHEYDDYVASPTRYTGEEVGSPSRSRALPTAPSNNSLTQPPEYSIESETDAYGGISSRDYNPVPTQQHPYPHEKR